VWAGPTGKGDCSGWAGQVRTGGKEAGDWASAGWSQFLSFIPGFQGKF
jgi:hypothetical protein